MSRSTSRRGSYEANSYQERYLWSDPDIGSSARDTSGRFDEDSSMLRPQQNTTRPLKGRSRSMERTPQETYDDDHGFDPITARPNKFDAEDKELSGLLENNRRWARGVQSERPDFFQNIALKQEPKVLWIGCADSRVPANQIVQLGPGEVFVHRNIANVVVHTDLNCLSVLQYAVEVLKVEHVIVCGHYRCGGVAAAMQKRQYGIIDNWLRNIKDVYRAHRDDLEVIEDMEHRERTLVELNVLASALNVAHSTIAQNAWAKKQRLLIHSWVYDLETGLIKALPTRIDNAGLLQDIYSYDTEPNSTH